jgi:carbohydrate-selective porin OprB
MPKVANGINLDANLARARAENLELEFRRNFIPHRAGILRLLAYVNHANMGSYREAIEAYRSGREAVPNIEAHRRQGRIKYGFGANFEQEVTNRLRIFGRYGWNEGRNESFAYTEVNNTIEFGGDLRGTLWRRRQDKVGAAFVTNGISGDHRLYLALGGRGFLLGDGALTYGRENIFEGYYNLHMWRGIFAALDLQHITNPGYNRDRGPVVVPALRLHLEF